MTHGNMFKYTIKKKQSKNIFDILVNIHIYGIILFISYLYHNGIMGVTMTDVKCYDQNNFANNYPLHTTCSLHSVRGLIST